MKSEQKRHKWLMLWCVAVVPVVGCILLPATCYFVFHYFANQAFIVKRNAVLNDATGAAARIKECIDTGFGMFPFWIAHVTTKYGNMYQISMNSSHHFRIISTETSTICRSHFLHSFPRSHTRELVSPLLSY